MMKIKDILRHRHNLALPRAQIVAAIGVSTGTALRVLAGAEAAGLSLPLPDDHDDEALKRRVYPRWVRTAPTKLAARSSRCCIAASSSWSLHRDRPL